MLWSTFDKKQLRNLLGLGLVKRRLKGNLIALHKSLTGGRSKVSFGLCSHRERSVMRGNSLKLSQGRLGWTLGKSFFSESAAQLCHRLPRPVVESPSVEAFNRCGTWRHGLAVALAVLWE